jgi:hypothetical protein
LKLEHLNELLSINCIKSAIVSHWRPLNSFGDASICGGRDRPTLWYFPVRQCVRFTKVVRRTHSYWFIGYDGVRLTSQICGLYGPTVHVIALWTMVWWYRLGLTPNLPTGALWQTLILLAVLSAETPLEQ